VTPTSTSCSGSDPSACALPLRALAAGGARATIRATTAHASVASGDPAIATFRDDGDTIVVWSGEAGETELQLLDDSGRVVDSSTVVVAPTAQLAVAITGTPKVIAGAAVRLHVYTEDTDGIVTLGDGSVRFAFDGAVSPLIVPSVDEDAGDFVGSVGSGTVTASCPSATLVQPIDVVAASAIDRLDTFVAPSTDDVFVCVSPHSPLGDVFAGACAWQTSDPTIAITSRGGGDDIGGVTLFQPTTSCASFAIGKSGTFTMTCTLAGQTTSVTVTR
jgi:hypothetical protein